MGSICGTAVLLVGRGLGLAAIGNAQQGKLSKGVVENGGIVCRGNKPNHSLLCASTEWKLLC
jgi:hypothetical protein